MRMKGRPTDAIKDTTVKVRLDDHTRKMLAYCVEAMNLSKSELIRLCIAKEYKLKCSIEKTLPYIKFRGYIVVFIKDLQPSKKETNLLHAEVIDRINEIPNVYYKGMKIWSDESTKLYPYGYPFCFVANQIHQYILVFRKEK